MLSLWYRYRDGAFHCATAADADVVRFLRANDEVAFEVSTNRPPYRGVRGNGTADLAPDEDKRVLSALVERYLDDTDSDLARWLLSPDREEVHVTVAPDRIHSWDYSDRMGDDADDPA
jgi:nitroimidazol reductase NimA-like FMN-containing flavoprotein (pyridoxamine 5'-phosphate oxidase superfamily)